MTRGAAVGDSRLKKRVFCRKAEGGVKLPPTQQWSSTPRGRWRDRWGGGLSRGDTKEVWGRRDERAEEKGRI